MNERASEWASARNDINIIIAWSAVLLKQSNLKRTLISLSWCYMNPDWGGRTKGGFNYSNSLSHIYDYALAVSEVPEWIILYVYIANDDKICCVFCMNAYIVLLRGEFTCSTHTNMKRLLSEIMRVVPLRRLFEIAPQHIQFCQTIRRALDIYGSNSKVQTNAIRAETLFYLGKFVYPQLQTMLACSARGWI